MNRPRATLTMHDQFTKAGKPRRKRLRVRRTWPHEGRSEWVAMVPEGLEVGAYTVTFTACDPGVLGG